MFQHVTEILYINWSKLETRNYETGWALTTAERSIASKSAYNMKQFNLDNTCEVQGVKVYTIAETQRCLYCKDRTERILIYFNPNSASWILEDNNSNNYLYKRYDFQLIAKCLRR